MIATKTNDGHWGIHIDQNWFGVPVLLDHVVRCKYNSPHDFDALEMYKINDNEYRFIDFGIALALFVKNGAL